MIIYSIWIYILIHWIFIDSFPDSYYIRISQLNDKFLIINPQFVLHFYEHMPKKRISSSIGMIDEADEAQKFTQEGSCLQRS